MSFCSTPRCLLSVLHLSAPLGRQLSMLGLGLNLCLASAYGQSLAIGANHVLATRIDGTLWAWGNNGYGKLDSDTSHTTSPIQVGDGPAWKSLAAGEKYSLGVRTNGTLWAWGENQYGQLGNGETEVRASLDLRASNPTQIGKATTWLSVAAGYAHSLAIRSDGTLWALGNNLRGGLGNGTTTDIPLPVQVGTSTNWHNVAGAIPIRWPFELTERFGRGVST